VRLLRPGGRALIYVWALEQEHNKQRSKYLKDPSKESPGGHDPRENTPASGASPQRTASCHGDAGVNHDTELGGTGGQRPDEDQVHRGKLSVHTNRTAFNSQDVLVPWHLKDGTGRVGKGRKEREREAGNGDKMRKRQAGSAVPKDNPAIDGHSLPSSGPTPDRKTESTDANQPTGLDSRLLQPSIKDPDDEAASKSCPGLEDAPSPAPAESSTEATVFHRYYHVFQQGEIEKVCGRVAGVQVQTSYHDQGNWCVILVKD